MSKRWNEHLRTAAVLFGLLSAATGTAPEAIAADISRVFPRPALAEACRPVYAGRCTLSSRSPRSYARVKSIGDLRWQPPACSCRLDRDSSYKVSATPVRKITELGVFRWSGQPTEDCLYLNVFTIRTSPGAERRNNLCCSDPWRRTI
jgi:hypothetical protein